MNLRQIAEKLGCTIEGDGALEITGVAGLDGARPGDLTFLSNRKYLRALSATRASAVLIAPGEPCPKNLAALRSKNPYLDFARAIELFHPAPKFASGVHPTAVIAPSAKIGANTHIGPYCFIADNVQIGDRAVLHSFVTIYSGARIGNNFFAHSHVSVRENCRIGDRVTLQNGVVVGSDGFGFARQSNDRGDQGGRWYKMRQAGIAVLEDDVEVQAHSAIDRATVGETRIGRGTKIDDLVLVGHACKVGEDTLLCGQVGLAGSTEVGKNCILAGQVGAAGHLTIGDGATVSSQSGVPGDVPAGAVFSGYPAMDNLAWRKSVAVFNRLPELQRELRELRAALTELQSRL